jgi:deoxyxylulose-5-phosphate synthase
LRSRTWFRLGLD